MAAVKRAAFFDLDKTLVNVNTGTLYVRWRVREGHMGVRELMRASFWSLQYTLGVLDAERMGAEAVRTLTGVPEQQFRDECASWVRSEVLRHVAQKARDELRRRRDEGYLCAILTSSSPYVAEPVAEHVGIEHVLCSRIQVREGSFTGALESPLCYGAGKVDKALQWAERHGVDLASSAFYTDSVSDLPMLERVGEPRVINPDPRLSRLARRRGWAVETWRPS